MFAPVRSDWGIHRYKDETKRLFSVLESRLQESPYLVGEKYTIADIASFPWVRVAPGTLDLELSEWPALKKWHDAILNREAVQKGLKIPTSKFSEEEFAGFIAAKKKEILAKENTDKH